MKQRKGGGQVQAGSVAEQNLCYNCFAQLQQTGGECPYCGFDPSDNAEKYPLALPMGCVLAGSYLVGRVLGQGGFGITYLAFDRRLQMNGHGYVAHGIQGCL